MFSYWSLLFSIIAICITEFVSSFRWIILVDWRVLIWSSHVGTLNWGGTLCKLAFRGNNRYISISDQDCSWILFNLILTSSIDTAQNTFSMVDWLDVDTRTKDMNSLALNSHMVCGMLLMWHTVWCWLIHLCLYIPLWCFQLA